MVKNPPANMEETQIQSLGREDPQEEEMTTHSSILAWEIAGTEEPSGLQSKGLQRVGHDLVTRTAILKTLFSPEGRGSGISLGALSWAGESSTCPWVCQSSQVCNGE